ncbi:ribokinase [Mycolicibacter hiberniae]|nr:ribokinase [Mycolicibacter hiberniae]MCV7085506.1 ribokinase [Mycolicibacter hiberniae]ORV71394.1 ribokinase [Mycolicibacter hiberniae]
MAARVCVVGSVNTDTVFRVGALPRPGETVLAETPRTYPGGKGANQAVAAARAGARVQFVGGVGDDDAGLRLRGHLRDNGVGTDGLRTLPEPSGAAFITVDPSGENTVVVAPGANRSWVLDSGQRDLIADCDVLLLQLEIPLAVAAAAAGLARTGGATVILNVSPPPADSAALTRLAALTDVAVVNESESARLHHEVPHRVVTLGARGARYRGSAGTYTVPAPAVRTVDSTGAGDVFAGVLATEWAGGVEHALQRACVAGALATLVRGAGDCAPDAESIGRAMKQLGI